MNLPMPAVLLLLGMVMLAMLIEPLSKKLHLPFSAILVSVGFIASEILVGSGIDTGLRYGLFVNLVLHVLLPVLVFEAAFRMPLRSLISNLLPILLMAVPFMLMTATVTGLAIFWGINHPGFPLMAALLTGVILSATDPVAVVALFERLHAPQRLHVLLEGESLFNDATVVVIYSLLIGLMQIPVSELPWLDASADFARHFLGGIAVGAGAGLIAAWLYRQSGRLEWCSLIAVGCVPAIYTLAEHWLHVSGIISVLCTGLVMGESHRRHSGPEFVSQFWQLTAYGANAVVFLLAGATITVGMFTSHWLAMLIGILAASLARGLVIYGLLPLSLMLPAQSPLPPGYKPVLQWGGLRGAVALALALALPTELDAWYSVQSIVYGVALFTLFVQAPLMEPLVKHALDKTSGKD